MIVAISTIFWSKNTPRRERQNIVVFGTTWFSMVNWPTVMRKRVGAIQIERIILIFDHDAHARESGTSIHALPWVIEV